MSFPSVDLHRDRLRSVEGMGFTVSRPIQKKTIPLAMADRDVLACAVTTRGKTAACLLPILDPFFAFTRTRRRADRLAGFLAQRDVQNLRDYIYQVARTALAHATGAAYPFVSSGKESRLRTMPRARHTRIECAPLRGCRPLCG